MKKPDHPEHRLSHYFDELLERIFLPPHDFTAVDGAAKSVGNTPEERAMSRMRWEEKRKRQGIKPHPLDWNLEQMADGTHLWRIARLELKYGSNPLTQGEKDTIAVLSRNHVPNGVAKTILECFEFLEACEFRLHGNARNIAIEVEARWRAADALARGADAPVKKREAPRKRQVKKATPAQIARAHASGVWRP